MKSNYGFDRDFIFRLQGRKCSTARVERALERYRCDNYSIDNRTVKKDAAITRTIESDGTIGEMGGIVEKTKAVADAGTSVSSTQGTSTVTIMKD